MTEYKLIMELAGKHVYTATMTGETPRMGEELIVEVPEGDATREAVVTVERVVHRPRDGARFVHAFERFAARDVSARLIGHLTGEGEAKS